MVAVPLMSKKNCHGGDGQTDLFVDKQFYQLSQNVQAQQSLKVLILLYDCET
ncbi:hypothetical protein DPMN_143572 [Dreissena polymorpha]|uniref:Uncharacterized protein n=1 Tax=Dreissena polymorpha TaxID=45954 RepID=A0A9D4GGL5_DREPO|nr:hypothetical protein DPMN_143572 [Dreissena polymorpha]